ncbi:type II toxin-antitoxin system RelE/ParE family toxin [Mangrovivirga sp. M17]|uniref:Type II toxin-antitoxin system RelE/ParE family toxin n=1 Tax=Mangrovivirga halotolerans TaxID=2993936 RepID=A0ABT3RV32_9BACT|nr:type II toxin-antitoxin system RelE/ParE family toxin [Mangrovivirga halotolerans]MCX2745625.1 type II toxin-antitoxin system RelE/ParE family toxin [Mangrovivirga halotolerans]
MYIIEQTTEFEKWFRKLKDRKAKAKILLCLQRIEDQGNYGDCQPIGEGLSELRIHYAKGYRVYFKEHGDTLVLLLIGGDKSTQSKDIKKAKELWEQYKNKI